MAGAGWRLPGYRIEELLGTGASGEVWRARVRATGIPVALKRVWVASPERRRTALSEAAMLATLDHPHLMRIHEVRRLERDDAIVLVLDLAAGGSLAALLARRGRLTVGEVITAIAPIGAALAYAHHAGVVHGDVSAANILFTDAGLPLLADLGVARLIGAPTPVRTTAVYADPLVASGGLPVPASDVFMLAGVALHALTGAPPWPRGVAEDLLDPDDAGRRPDFAGRLTAAGVPDPVTEVLARALSVEPGFRGTAADLALELRHADRPVAVELTAGRARVPPAVARGAPPVERIDSWPVAPVRAAEPAGPGEAPAPAVPAFVGQPPFTDGVRPPEPFGPRHAAARGTGRSATGRRWRRARPRWGRVLLPRRLPSRLPRRLPSRLPRRPVGWPAGWPAGSSVQWSVWGRSARRMAAIAVGGVLLAGILVLLRWTPTAPERAGPEGAASGPVSQRAVEADRTPAVPRSPSRRSAPTPVPATPAAPARLDAGDVRAVLARLDATRAAAFARRDPAVLATVYASAVLVARDRAALTAIVAPGCVLRGVRTSFSGLAVAARRAGRVVVRARSRLAPATLVCGGRPSGRAPPGRRERVELVLAWSAGGYRIAARRVLGG